MTKKHPVSTVFALVFCFLFVQGCSSSTLVDFLRWVERTKTGVTEKSIQVGDHKIAYLEGGAGDAIVLLHGFADSKDSWVKFARPLTKKYRVIMLDLPGFGDSSKVRSASYDTKSQVDRLKAFLEKLDLKRVHIAGNSLGGLLAGIYAVEYPSQVLTLCLIDTAGVANIETSEYEKCLLKGENPLIVETPDDYDRMLKFVFVHPPSIPGPVKKYLVTQNLKNREFNKKIFADAFPGSQLELKLDRIQAKTLVIWGDTDRIFPVSSTRVLEKGIGDIRVVIMKECGHTPMSERPQEAAWHYLTFLTGQ
jgi:pimeloyl-ACP methyl ester carboxylesterase